MAEIGWAARVEHAAFQDFMHYVRGSRAEVACLTHLSSDAQILAEGPRASPGHPQGPMHAMWVDNATGEWNSVVSNALDLTGEDRMHIWPVAAELNRSPAAYQAPYNTSNSISIKPPHETAPDSTQPLYKYNMHLPSS